MKNSTAHAPQGQHNVAWTTKQMTSEQTPSSPQRCLHWTRMLKSSGNRSVLRDGISVVFSADLPKITQTCQPPLYLCIY